MSTLLLRGLINELLQESRIKELRAQFVDSGKVSKEDFELLVKASGNVGEYVAWLVSRFVAGVITLDELGTLEKYLKLFKKYPKEFTFQQISQYKTQSDMETFKSEAEALADKASPEGESRSGHITPNEIRALAKVGVEYLGKVDGYQAFQVNPEVGDSLEKWKVYRNTLGRCQDRDVVGGGIKVCVMGSLEHVNNYLRQGPFYVFYNLNDPLSPYHWVYGDKPEFKDKNNTSVV